MIVGIITARANSKGLPGKNMMDLGGKPLIQHSFDIAIKSGVFDKIILSTDSDAAIDLASSIDGIEVPFIRPSSLSADDSSQFDVVKHALDFLISRGETITHFVLLQPTAPFRKVSELIQGVNLMREHGNESVIGVTKVMHHPADYLYVNSNHQIQYLMPEFAAKNRQSFPPIYFNNGAFYGCQVNFFMEKKVFYNEDSALLMMSEYSLVDIDTNFDFTLANALIKEFNNAI